jgi:hypothetical protein
MSTNLLEPHQCKVLQGLFTWMAEGLHANGGRSHPLTNATSMQGCAFEIQRKKPCSAL